MTALSAAIFTSKSNCPADEKYKNRERRERLFSTLKNTYMSVSRGRYGRFGGFSISVGVRSLVCAELHLYRREFERYGVSRMIGGYTNFIRMG